MSAESEEEAQAMQLTAASATFTGYTVESSSFGIFYDDEEVPDTTTDPTDPTDPTNPEDELNTTALIVGVVLGGVILIALIAFIIYKVKSGSGAQKIGDQDTASFENAKKPTY